MLQASVRFMPQYLPLEDKALRLARVHEERPVR